MKPIVIFGAGGFGREVLALIRDINAVRPVWDVLGFLDDDPERAGELHGVRILGDREWLRQADASPHFVFGVGSPAIKRRISESVRDRVASFPVLIHPTVTMAESVALEEGVVITAGNILTTDIQVDRFAMVNLACTVGHDVRLGEYVSVSPGVNISGDVRVGQGCDIGTGAKVIQGVEIGEWTVVGAGAVVARSLPANCTAVGVPARPIKQREAGWHLE